MYWKILLSIFTQIILLISVNAQNTDSEISEIRAKLINGDYESGLEACKRLIESNLNDTIQLASVYGYAGLSSEVLGNSAEAINYYEEAVKYQVPQLDIYDKLISLSKKQKNDSVYEFALLEKARAFPEYNKSIKKSLAYQYANTKQYEKLLSTTNDLLSWNPNEINFLFFKGVALQNLDQIEQAKDYYNEVLKLNPDHAGANMSIGLLLFNSGSEIFETRKKEYEALTNPDRVDYSVYKKGIENGKELYIQALPYLLKAYESGSYPGLNKALYNTYVRLDEKERAESYR